MNPVNPPKSNLPPEKGDLQSELSTGLVQMDDKPLPGFRLSKLEVYNWGIFDGAVFTLPLHGKTTLLVGENGSGKSTLVDALLTLLVRPQTRNYNVAAGAGKHERDERSYIRGAHDRTQGSDNRPQTIYMRSGIGQYSVLLGTFSNQTRKTAFTLCQVLYLNSDSSVERVYAYCEGERSIVADLGNLTSGSTLAKQLRERGFETTTSYSQYFNWWQRKTSMRSKAMDIFNQTVAVKDVQRLDVFIRQHMLEKQPWNERVSKLLAHFQELSEAHAFLVKARRQDELLRPVVQASHKYREKLEEQKEEQARYDALSLYFANERRMLLEPYCQKWDQQIRFLQEELLRLDERLEELRTNIMRLEAEIEHAGGDRLRQLPELIRHQDQMAATKREIRNQFVANLKVAGIRIEVTSPEQFHKVREQLVVRKQALLQQRDEHRVESNKLQYEIGRLKQQFSDEEQELRSLERRKGNLPESLISLRDGICRDLNIAPSDLPFAAELLDVRDDCRSWQASIEQVLHGFARSLLVTEHFYSKVAGYIDATALTDQRGVGQKLVYLRVPSRWESNAVVSAGPSLSAMLQYRPHLLIDWVKAEIRERFDFQACDSIEEFKRASGKAMTRNRHIRSNVTRHEKDDRSLGHERKYFVLGWDNREKQSALRDSLRELQRSIEQLQERDDRLVKMIDRDTQAIEVLGQLARVEDFDQIDADRHEFEATQLRLEKQRLEESNDIVKELRTKVQNLRAEAAGYQLDRDQTIERRKELNMELSQGRRLLENDLKILAQAEADGTWELHRTRFEELASRCKEKLTLENLGTLRSKIEHALRKNIDDMTQRLKPMVDEIVKGMGRFLRNFQEEYSDLDADLDSINSFLALHDRIVRDDLPKYEERFKNRLNEKVLHEVGLLNSSLENDRQEIRDKILQLNGALERLEWKPGTFMRLEATDVHDREIQDFRRELSACLSGTLDGTPEANEATFLRIEKLVARLRDGSNHRWLEKVADVRNWFNFAASEFVRSTQEPRSYYDGGAGQSGGEKGKLAFLVLVAAIAFQYDLDPDSDNDDRFHFVMVDEMFSRSDDHHAEYAMDLFEQFGLQLLIVAPLDAKVRVTEPYVGTYIQVVKDRETQRSSLLTISAEQLRDALEQS